MISIPAIGLLKQKGGIPFAGSVAPYDTIYRPETAAQWAMLGGGVIAPDHLYLCQSASGGIPDEIGAIDLSNVLGSPGYQATVANWYTFWITTAEGGAHGIRTAVGVPFFDGLTQSCFVLGYHAFNSTPGANRVTASLAANVLQLGTTSVAPVGRLRLQRSGAIFANSGNVYAPSASPRCVTMMYDIRGAGLFRANASLGDSWSTPSFALTATPAQGLSYIGSNQAFGGRHNLWAAWVGSRAETMMDLGGANLGGVTLMNILGW